ncbi:unnamed protein product [Scytosiphon promiscuus]
MAASLLRKGTYNSRDIKFELEATMVVFEASHAPAMKKLGPKLEVSPATKRLWRELQQEMIALEGLYSQATGEDYQPPEPVRARDMGALETFFEAMHGRRWLKLAGWLGRTATANSRGVPPFSCNPWCWDGVECGVGDVQGLFLRGNQLQGVLPGQALADMHGLVTLDLSDNEIEGTLPRELGELVHLQYLRLAVTKLEGCIPDTLGLIKGLRELDLSYSSLAGRIPASLGGCVKLASLNLAHNRLHGSIPPELGSLRGLRELLLGHNRLTGIIPASFGELVRLRSLSLACNNLQGSLPPWLGKLASLRVLLLDGNQLTGRLPQTLENLQDLEVVHLQLNSLRGTIPRCLGKLRALRVLNLAGNRLEGKIPAEFGDLANLAGLELGQNLIVGPIPEELGRLSRLVDLHVLEGCPSYSLQLHRAFSRHAFERVFITGPSLGLNNTNYPRGEEIVTASNSPRSAFGGVSDPRNCDEDTREL